jgi:hypothetical protein
MTDQGQIVAQVRVLIELAATTLALDRLCQPGVPE